MKNKIFFSLMLCTFLWKGYAQELSIDADIRPRFEYRHGFHNLVPENSDPAAFVQQRSRLKFGYTSEKFKASFSFQDVSIWGDTRQILPVDNNDSFQIADAWISFELGSGWSTKLGRQALSYDDQRILGGLDWAMQGRFHDLALVSHAGEKSKLDIGIAFSQNSGAGAPGNEIGNIYDVTGFFSYKAMQMIHYNVKASETSSISLLAMNNTFQNTENGAGVDGFFHRHTIGTHSKFKLGTIGLAANAYYQFGEAAQEVDLSSYLLGLEATTKAGSTGLGLGFELQSGTDQDDTSGDNNSFFPLYGTNHKFNGFMDYFYVGNHANNVGLTDIYAKAVFKTGEKSNLMVKGHYFGAAATLLDPADGSEADSYLGTELDLVFTQKLLPFATLKLGYSHMFAGDSMEILKGVEPDGAQNWGWAMLVVKPNFLKWKPASAE